MIGFDDSPMDAIVKMSQGNPGAASVLAQLLKSDFASRFMDVLHADDMGLKGPAIWIGYKDWAGQDIEKFRMGLRNRSKEMIAVIRSKGYEAVEHGAS